MHHTMTLQSLPKRFINCLKEKPERYDEDTLNRIYELEEQVTVLTYMVK